MNTLDKHWEKEAANLKWSQKWDQVFSGTFEHPQWFVGGKLNVCENCLDRHQSLEKTALIWEGEDGSVQKISYQELLTRVQKMANVLKKLGCRKGDRVVLYLGMIPEVAVAMLACARIGAIHSVIFGGFGVDALKSRVQDLGARFVITADGGFRRGKTIGFKESIDEILPECLTVEKVVVAKRTKQAITMQKGRDYYLDELLAAVNGNCLPEAMEAEDPLFVLYTSGTTGKPKGILHTTGGYLTGVTTTFRQLFSPTKEDVYWCTADFGWITGHSYGLYGALSNGVTTLMYEGSPDYPTAGRIWEICQRHQVSILYTAPTLIRDYMRRRSVPFKEHDLSSLRLLGSVGEPINPDVWLWYSKNVGAGKCPIIDTWWQTETGMVMIAPLPSLEKAGKIKPGSAGKPLNLNAPEIVDQNGNPVKDGETGYLTLTKPWPSMLRGVWGDMDRYHKTYWDRFPGKYLTGDFARRDEDGDYWLLGRSDDIIVVAGHNISTVEVEAVLIEHELVAEVAVIGEEDPITGQAIVAYVILLEGIEGDEGKITELKKHVSKKAGPILRPKEIIFVQELPKTRSGKIMRRVLRDERAGGGAVA